MDNSILYAIMIAVAILMAILPFGIFIGLANIVGATADDSRLLAVLFLGATLIMFLVCFGSFALIQRANCNSIKNYSQIATNAAIAAAFEAGALLLSWLFTPMRNIITGLFPMELEKSVQNALGFSYYGFWGALFGVAIGGTFSAVC